MTAIAFKAVYIDAKSMRGVKAVRFTFDVPVEDSNEALEVLGGMPRPDEPVYVGITRIKEGAQAAPEPPQAQLESPAYDRSASFPNEKEHKRFNMLPLSQQAGIRCGDPAFWKFLNEQHFSEIGLVDNADAAAGAVRHVCGVASRADLKSNTEAGRIWTHLNRDFEVWMLG